MAGASYSWPLAGELTPFSDAGLGSGAFLPQVALVAVIGRIEHDARPSVHSDNLSG